MDNQDICIATARSAVHSAAHSTAHRSRAIGSLLTLRAWTVIVTLSALHGCLATQVVPPEVAGEVAGDDSTPEPSTGEVTMLLSESALLIRVIPVDTSAGAERFCVAAALQPDLLVTSASCFEGGVGFAEVKVGSSISFSGDEGRVGVVTSIYRHPAYVPGIPADNGYNIAIVKISPVSGGGSIPVVELFEESPEGVNPLVRVGYKQLEDASFQRAVRFGVSPTVESAVLKFPDMNLIGEPCPVGGAPIFTFSGGQAKLVAIGARGSSDCTEGGSAGIVNASRELIISAFENSLAPDADGPQEPGQLSCAQYFLCNQFQFCQQQLRPSALEQIQSLVRCAQGQGCLEPSCYADTCPEEYESCVGD